MKKLSLLTTLLLIFILIGNCSDDVTVVEDKYSNNLENVYINEVCSKCSPDWIEIYNDNDNAITLYNSYIYDSSTLDDKYKLSSYVIEPKDYLVIYCTDEGIGLETNFKLSASEGETVFLEDSSGNLIDKLTFIPLEKNYSYGRSPDASSNLTTFTESTKGKSNN